MNRIVVLTLVSFFVVGVFFSMSEAQNYNNQSKNNNSNNSPPPPSYNYQQHANDNYNRSVERYIDNPTSQNRQVMNQREKVNDMRQNQYQQNNWPNSTNQPK